MLYIIMANNNNSINSTIEAECVAQLQFLSIMAVVLNFNIIIRTMEENDDTLLDVIVESPAGDFKTVVSVTPVPLLQLVSSFALCSK